MAITPLTVTIDLNPSYKKIPAVYVSQLDNNLRSLAITVQDGGVNYDVASSGYDVYVEGTKPDKHGFSYKVTDIGGTVVGSVVTVPMQTQMTCVQGMVPTEIVLKSGADRIGSANFLLVVERAGLAEDVDVSETDIPAYINGAQQAAAAALQSAEDAEDAKDTAVNAATTAQNVLDSIPEDYSQMSDDLSAVKSAFENPNVMDYDTLVFAPNKFVTANGQVSDYTGTQSIIFAVEPETSYYLKINGGYNRTTVIGNSTNEFVTGNTYTKLTASTPATDGITFTTPQGIYYVMIYFYSGTYTFEKSNFILYEGSAIPEQTAPFIKRENMPLDTLFDDSGDFLSLKNSSVKRRIPVVYGGFSFGGSQMWEVDNTIRTKTPICDVSEYGNGVIISLPSTIKINTIVAFNGTEWLGLSPLSTEYDFDDTITKFRVSFVNKSDPTAVISESELNNINVIPTYRNYFDTVIPESVTWYVGKKYAALGDSITYGFIPRNYAGYPGQLDSFAKLAAEKLGMTFANYGNIGNTIAAASGITDPMSERYINLPNDADLITVMGGTNDIRNNVPLGQMTDRTNTTFYGALHVLFGGLYKKYFIDQGTTTGESKKIVVCTPIKLLSASASTQGGTGTLVNFDSFCNAIKEVAAYYSLPVLDFQNLSGINPHLNETIQGTEEGYTGFYNPYITDGTHPTQEGAEIMSNVLVGFLKSII